MSHAHQHTACRIILALTPIVAVGSITPGFTGTARADDPANGIATTHTGPQGPDANPRTLERSQHVLLEEVVQHYAGTEQGRIHIARAPAPGQSTLVRRADVLRTLRDNGLRAPSQEIPPQTRIERGVEVLRGSKLKTHLRAQLDPHLTPCSVDTLQTPPEARIPENLTHTRVEGYVPPQSGRISVSIVHHSGNHMLRIPVRASILCPPPAVSPGTRVRVLAVFGNVRASTPGEVKQPGRIGDVVRVTNLHSGRTIQARVKDSQHVEVIQ